MVEGAVHSLQGRGSTRIVSHVGSDEYIPVPEGLLRQPREPNMNPWSNGYVWNYVG